MIPAREALSNRLSRSKASRHFRDALLIFLLALAVLHIAYYFRVVLPRPSLRFLGGGDPYEYDGLARSLLAGKGFSDIMFGLRPPGFPLFIALVYVLAGVRPHIVVFYHLIFGALTVVVVYKLSLRLFRQRSVAILTALLMTFEVAHVDSIISVMSEPLHNLLLFIALYWLVVCLQSGRWRAALAAGVAMGMALLTRPISAYFALLLGLLALIYRPRLWKQVLAFIAICLVCWAAWSYRNLYYAGNFSLSTTGSYTMLFYKMVSAESHATGRPPEEVATDIALEVERRVGNYEITREEIAEYPVGRPENLHANDPERQAIFRQMVFEKVRAYPLWTAIMTAVSLVRQFEADEEFLLPVWLQLALTAIYLMLALIGYWRAWVRRETLFLLLSHASIVYYAGTTALVLAGLSHIRLRTPYMPFILMYGALGIVYLAGRRDHRVGRGASPASG